MKLTKSESKCYIKTFRHFSLRLSERYGILITFEEYVMLCKLQYLKKQKKKMRREHDKTSVYVGLLQIGGQTVRVVKSSSTLSPLITVLPLEEEEV